MLTKKAISTTIFIAIVIISAIFLIVSTSNYVEFYRAIETLDLTIMNASPSVEQNEVNITLIFSITNPTRYVGLKLQELSFALYFQNNSENIDLWWKTLAYHNQPVTIDPYWNNTFEYHINLDVNADSTKRFQDLYQTQQGNVKWLLKSGAIVITFAGEIDVPLTAEYLSHS